MVKRKIKNSQTKLSSKLASGKNKYIDSDADGISNEEEIKLGTNPYKKDSDNDGLDDYEEVFIYKTDPNNPDTDNDGLSDGEEVRRGLNPRGKGTLRDLFIPHSGNNYRPNSLHPKRLFFHAASAILIKAILVIFVLAFPIEAWLTPDIQLEQSKKIIALTNQIRQNLGINILTENKLLDQASVNKAEDMLINQYFAHVSPKNKSLVNWLAQVGYKYKTAGENLAMGFANAEDVVNAWTKSETHYANLTDKGYSEIGVGMSSGLYNNYDTTFVAQMFGEPLAVKAEVAVPKTQIPIASSSQSIIASSTSVTTIAKNTKPELVAPPEAPIIEKPQTNFLPTTSETKAEVKGVSEIKPPIELTVKKQPLIVPELISPVGNIFNSHKLTFKIKAPQADKIIIYGNDNKVLNEINNSESEIVEAKLNLNEGVNNIIIESNRGSESEKSNVYLITVDTTAPVVDLAKTNVSVVEENNSQIVKATAYLSADTSEAEVNVGNFRIKLAQNDINKNEWNGQAIIFNEKNKQIFNPVVMSTLTAKDALGNISTTDIEWKNIIPVKPSLLNQYFFFKSNQSKYLKPLFSLSSVYYELMIIFFVIALILDIFIEIKKQHPHIILASLGVIGLMIILIVI